MLVDLQQWLDHITNLHPQTIDLSLARVKKVAERLGVNECACPVITVGGTNGKGSTVAVLEQILLAAHYKVACFTSPHLLQFNERFRINGKIIADEPLCEAFHLIEKARQEISLTYFEFNLLAALIIFNHYSLDAIILEVGLGGRLDAVNIIEPTISVITNIALDHTDYLGETREEIAKEKAGILRFEKPSVCGDPNPPQSLLKSARELNAELFCQGRDFYYQENNHNWSFYSEFQSLENLPKPRVLLQNAATALMTLQLLKNKLPVLPNAISQGLTEVYLEGRFQVIEKPVKIILDVAHNPDSAQVLAVNLLNQHCPGKTFAVWSMLENKDHALTLQPLLSIVDKWFYAPLSQPRAATVQQLEEALKRNEVEVARKSSDISGAYHSALQEARNGDRIVVFGSFYTVAEIMPLIPY